MSDSKMIVSFRLIDHYLVHLNRVLNALDMKDLDYKVEEIIGEEKDEDRMVNVKQNQIKKKIFFLNDKKKVSYSSSRQ